MRISLVLIGSLLVASVAYAMPIPILRSERDFAQIRHLRIPIPPGFQWMEIFPCQNEARRWELIRINRSRRSTVMAIERFPKFDATIDSVVENAWATPTFNWSHVERVEEGHVNDAFAWRSGFFTGEGEGKRAAVLVHIVDGDAYVLRVHASAGDDAFWKALTTAARAATKNVPLLKASGPDPFCADR